MVYFLLLIGFICLVKGADFFVSGSSAIARYFHISAFVIGLTIVAFGTSLPEAAVSITAALKGANGIAVGNVLGSNLFNLLMVLGLSAIVKACPVSNSTLRFEYPLSIAAAALVLILLAGKGDNALLLSRADGLILLAVFCFFLFMTVRTVISGKGEPPAGLLSEADPPAENKDFSLPKGILYSIIGVAGIILGGDLVVDSASEIAAAFGIDETLIGLTIVAVGTSLPELVTSMVAAFKGETDIATGNVIGSNLFNLLFVLGLSVFIHPIRTTIFSVYDAGILILVSLLPLIPMARHKAVTRNWGILLILLYAAYLTYIILRTM